MFPGEPSVLGLVLQVEGVAEKKVLRLLEIFIEHLLHVGTYSLL